METLFLTNFRKVVKVVARFTLVAIFFFSLFLSSNSVLFAQVPQDQFCLSHNMTGNQISCNNPQAGCIAETGCFTTQEQCENFIGNPPENKCTKVSSGNSSGNDNDDTQNQDQNTGSGTGGNQDAYTLLAPFPGSPAPGASPELAPYLQAIFSLVLGIAVVLSVIMIVIGGIQWMSESVFTHTEGKEKIKWAIGGLLLALLSYVFLQIINPELLKVGFNLPGLTLQGAAYTERAVAVEFTGGIPGLPRFEEKPWCVVNNNQPDRIAGACWKTKEECEADLPDTGAFFCKNFSTAGCANVATLSGEIAAGSDVCLGNGAFVCKGRLQNIPEAYRFIIEKTLKDGKEGGVFEPEITAEEIGAIMFVESYGGTRPEAVSNRGACGLMQVLPGPPLQCGDPPIQTCIDRCRAAGLFEPGENIRRGIGIYNEYYETAKEHKIGLYKPGVVTVTQLALSRYNDGAYSMDPSENCTDSGTGSSEWNNSPVIPKFACPILPGDMCGVRDYACKISACLR